jgi:hypothetical protein
MVDVRKRMQQWMVNLEREKRPENRQQQYPPVEITTPSRDYKITAELAAQLNTEIANYNRHRNALSLWNVLTICIENRIPVPGGVGEFFLNISQKLIRYAHDGEKQARELISDLVLGTINEDGGPGKFQSYRNVEQERDIVRRVGEIALQQIESGFQKHKTLEAIYETVAEEHSVQADHVKKLVRLYEGGAGSFDLRELFKAATSPPQVFASGLDTTSVGSDDEVHSEKPSD